MGISTILALGVGLLLNVVAPCMVAAQSHFENRMTSFSEVLKKLPQETTGTILMVGDSITEGFSSSGMLPEKIAGLPVINQGIGGDIIGTSTSKVGVRSRLDAVAKAKPAVVFLMIGVNNMWAENETADQLIRDYEELIPALKAAVPQAKLVLQSVLPVGPSRDYVNPKAKQLNNRIKELAVEHGAVWLDLHPIMAGPDGKLKAEFTNDDVHLTNPAYEAWLKEVEATAEKLVESK